MYNQEEEKVYPVHVGKPEHRPYYRTRISSTISEQAELQLLGEPHRPENLCKTCFLTSRVWGET